VLRGVLFVILKSWILCIVTINIQKLFMGTAAFNSTSSGRSVPCYISLSYCNGIVCQEA
jgi:hypothetical protein